MVRAHPLGDRRCGGEVTGGLRGLRDEPRIGELFLHGPILERERERVARIALDLEREPRFFAHVDPIASLGGRGDPIAHRAYDEAIGLLASLRAPVDAFFEGVLVMDPDEVVRRNRLALLNMVIEPFAGFADLKALEG